MEDIKRDREKIQKIKNIIEREIEKELISKQNEVTDISEKIKHVLRHLDLLKYIVAVNYYDQNTALTQKKSGQEDEKEEEKAQQFQIHPCIKKLMPFRSNYNKSFTDLFSSHSYETRNSKKNFGETVNEERKEVSSISKQEKCQDLNSNLKMPQYIPPLPSDKETLGTVNSTRGSVSKECYKVIVGNISKWIPPDTREDNSTHKWMVYIRNKDSNKDVTQLLKKVRYFLHESYKPHDIIDVTSPPFRLTRRGWGEFPIRVQLHFTHPLNKPVDIIHNLKLDMSCSGVQMLGGETAIEISLHQSNSVSHKKDSSKLDSSMKIESSKTETVKEKQDVFDGNLINNLNGVKPGNCIIDIKKEVDEDEFDSVVIKQEPEESLDVQLLNSKIDEMNNALSNSRKYLLDRRKILKAIEVEHNYLKADESQPYHKCFNNLTNSVLKLETVHNSNVEKNFKNGAILHSLPACQMMNKKTQEQSNKMDMTFRRSEEEIFKNLKAATSRVEVETQSKYSMKMFRHMYLTNIIQRAHATKLKSVESLIRWFVQRWPIITKLSLDPTYKTVHPYSSPSEEEFFTYNIGKQRSSEWFRAKAIQKVLKSLKEIVPIEEEIWSTKQILLWSRFHGYTPSSPQKNPKLEARERREGNKRLKPNESSSESDEENFNSANKKPKAFDEKFLNGLNVIERKKGHRKCRKKALSDEGLDRIKNYKDCNTCSEANDSQRFGAEAFCSLQPDSLLEIDVVTVPQKAVSESPQKKKEICLSITTTLAKEVLFNKFVNDAAKQIGVKVFEEEVIPGVKADSVSRVLAQCVSCFLDELLRRSLAQAWLRNGERWVVCGGCQSIVCAVSALREGTEIIGRKNYGSDAFGHFEGGPRKEGKTFSPRGYNVGAHNSSAFAMQKITDRTNFLNCDFINKQYQSGKSVMENVFQRKKNASFHSDVGLEFRKRNLLWSTNRISPKTLRPPMEIGNEYGNCPPTDWNSECCKTGKCGKCGKGRKPSCPKGKKQPCRKRKFNSDSLLDSCSLNCRQKKLFLLHLKKLSGKMRKRHLDRVKIDDELDLNKRIQKLVQEIAAENQRTALTGRVGESSEPVASGVEKPPEKNQKSFPFFEKLKKMFRFNTNNFNNKKNNNDNPNSVPVNSVRGEVPIADKTAHISDYDALKTQRETARFRRNPYRNHLSYSQGDNSLSRYRENIMIRKPYPYSNNYKKKAKFLYPQYRQRLLGDNRRPHRLLHTPQKGMKLWPYSNRFILKPNIKDFRSKRHNDEFQQSLVDDDMTTKDSNSAQTGGIAGPNGAEITKKGSDHLEEPTDDASMQENLGKSNAEDNIPDYTLEKPFLERHFRYDFSDKGGANADLKTFEDRYNLMTDFPLFDNPIAHLSHGRIRNHLPKDELLNPYRYLKIRHALRNYLIHNNILSPLRIDSSAQRGKRCGGGKCCPMPHKCWRSPPLLCIPYIRKGQDDLLRYLIRTMQKMIGRPFPPKIDIFENTKYKPCDKNSNDDDMNYDDNDCDCMNPCVPPPCLPITPCPPPPPPPPPTTTSSCPCQVDPTSKLPSCSLPYVALPRPLRRFPFAPNVRPCPPNQRSCPYGSYSPLSEYGPEPNAYPATSQYQYSNENIDQSLYSTRGYCGYDEPIPTSPCVPGNPYCRSTLTSPSPPIPASNYPPTPSYNPFSRPSEKTPVAFTRTPYSPHSTQNACSWYMSKSPIERSEYFAYTALPFNGLPEPNTAPAQLVQSEPPTSANIQAPCPRPSAQSNQPAPQKFYFQTSPTYVERPPLPISPGMNPQLNTEPIISENQCKERRKIFDEVKQFEEVPADQMNHMRKESHGRPDSNPGDNFSPQGVVRCEDQQHHRLNENQIMKPEMNSAQDDQQISKSEANNEYTKPLAKEQNPQIIQNSHPGLSAEGNDGASKNQNSEDTCKCGNQRYSLSDQQMPKPDTKAKEVKNPNKEEAFRCPDRQCTSNERQQLPKPELNEMSDDRRFFKTKHHKGILKNFRKPATEFFHSYDDYYDKPLLRDPEELSGFRYGKSPFMRAWKGYSRKVKKASKRGSSVRQKRDDKHDALVDSFENYNDYESEFGYNDVSPDSDDSKGSGEAPSYEMFSELAKAVTGVDNTTSDSSSDTKATTAPVNQTSRITTAAYKSPSLETYDIVQKKMSGNGSTPSVPLNGTNDDVSESVKSSTKGDASTTETITSDARAKSANMTAAPYGKITLNSSVPGHEGNKSSKGESIDSKKFGKTGFFQTNSKSLAIQSNSGFLTTTKVSNLGLARDDKELDGSQDLDSAEEGQIPTTLRTASIVKGPKKMLTKPSPKVYTKVYPDSMPLEPEANETGNATTGTTAKAIVEKTTLVLGSTSDIQVQLLAVCEGYLEVIKLIKAQNQTLGDDLDANLARYCENIISQNFNLQSESTKPKKQDSVQSSSFPAETSMTVATTATTRTSAVPSSSPHSRRKSHKKTSKNKATEAAHRSKVVVDIPNIALYKRGTIDNTKNKNQDFRRKKIGFEEFEDLNNEETGVTGRNEKSQLRWKKSDKTKDFCLSTQSDSESIQKNSKRYRRKEQAEDELLRKGITKEQVELLHLLRKRKRALLSWLYNTKEVPNKPNEAQETEYFDDEEEIVQGSDFPSDSGTITPKEYEITSTTSESEESLVNETIFPVYAKQYGYDRGGELMEVEVLWRKINEKTHEEKIFKNLSVLALLLPSTNKPSINHDGTRLLPNGFEGEEMSEAQSNSENKVGYADSVANCNKKTTTVATIIKDKNSSCANNTYTYINKPDPSSIVGAPPNSTVLHPNCSRKISHKFNAARDLFQEYTLEFLNYAVYILPIMFTVLFVFCCLCCAVQILKTKKCSRKHKKKKKRQFSTEDSETSEDSERESKKKRREARRKKHSKDCAGDLDKKRSKTFWNVLKMNSGKANAEYDESQTEKKRSFLRFLKGRRDECKAEMFSPHYSPVREVDEQDDIKESLDSQVHEAKKRKDENPKTYSQSEAEERRELIALLEELKKIETENTGEKKEVKSVQVQYMTQEDDSPVFQRPEFAFPYQKNVFGMPKGYSLCNKHFPFYQSDPATVRNYELFEDVNELTELLPCECNYYSKRNDYLRHCDFKIKQEGGCKSLIKIFRDAGVTRSKPFREKNLFNNESENRSFIFNKYRSISTDTSDELLGVAQKTAGTEVKLTDNIFETASPFKLHSKTNTDFVEEMDSLKRELNSKKHVRLKDDGVLCRL